MEKRGEEEKHPVFKQKLTFGQRSADKLTKFVGSWTFIFILFILMIVWVCINLSVIVFKWDPYPFILLNLLLSMLAAIQAPIILMSQNRESQRDRIVMRYDYRVNRVAEREIRDMQSDLEEIKKLIKEKRLTRL